LRRQLEGETERRDEIGETERDIEEEKEEEKRGR